MNVINLYGAGDHGKVVMDIVRSLGYDVNCIYDDEPAASKLNGIKVIASDSVAEIEGPVVVAIGDNQTRKRISRALARKGILFEHIAHSTAVIAPDVTIGTGSVVSHGAIIQTGSKIGSHCIINTGAIVDHDCEIEDYVHIAPGSTLCGKIKVGEGAWIGAGSVIIPGVTIGKWSVIGAGSVVLKDVPDKVVAFGNPTKVFQNFK